MKKTLEWTHPALHLVQKALVAAVAIIAAVGLFAVPATAFAEDSTLDAPVHSKSAKMNDDGTIDITLDVTGNSVQHSVTSQADVIVVLDLSGSMNYRTSWYDRTTRLDVAKDAVDSLAENLLAQNSEHHDAVRLALVTFNDYASSDKQFYTNATDFQNKVDNLKASGGTNWEDALSLANSIETRDPKQTQTYIIFVSDGDPTLRNTRGEDSWWPSEDKEYIFDGHYVYGSGTTDYNGKNYNCALQVAQSITGAGKTLFSVGVFGDVTEMQKLVEEANQPSSNYHDAKDSAALNKAFDDIVKTITTDVSYKDVSISDPINTDAVEFCLPGGSTSGTTEFTYKKDGKDWADAPKASIVGSTVNWDLSDIGVLETGVTYSVSFKVRLTQEAYNAAADDDPKFDAYDAEHSKDGTYQVFTNDNGTLDYRVITSSSDGTTNTSDPMSTGYKNQHVAVPVSTLHISKTWIPNGATLPPSLTVNVMRDNDNSVYRTVTLRQEDKNWSADVKVAAGPKGHTYSVVEDMSGLSGWDSSFDNNKQSVSFISLTSMSDSVVLTNTFMTGTLELTKNLKGNAANGDDQFEFTLTCVDLADGTYGDATFRGGKATVYLKNGDTKTLNNLPAGKTVTIAETPSGKNQARTTTTATVKVGDSTPTSSAGTSVDAPIEYRKTTAVTYTNKTEIAPDTGLDISTTSQGVLLGVAAAGAATLAAAAIRKNHGERKEK